jgi:hypothetical protein
MEVNSVLMSLLEKEQQQQQQQQHLLSGQLSQSMQQTHAARLHNHSHYGVGRQVGLQDGGMLLERDLRFRELYRNYMEGICGLRGVLGRSGLGLGGCVAPGGLSGGMGILDLLRSVGREGDIGTGMGMGMGTGMGTGTGMGRGMGRGMGMGARGVAVSSAEEERKKKRRAQNREAQRRHRLNLKDAAAAAAAAGKDGGDASKNVGKSGTNSATKLAA